jgi:hypothetical protein
MTQIGVFITPVSDDRSRDSFINNKQEARKLNVFCSLSNCRFLGLLFEPEDGGRMFLRNVGKFLPDYAVSHLRR